MEPLGGWLRRMRTVKELIPSYLIDPRKLHACILCRVWQADCTQVLSIPGLARIAARQAPELEPLPGALSPHPASPSCLGSSDRNEEIATGSLWIGIDVSGKRLEVFIRPSEQRLTGANSPVGLAVLVKEVGEQYQERVDYFPCCSRTIAFFYQDRTMGMNIKDQETHDIARELASLTGQSLTEAIKPALRHELKRAKIARARRARPLAERLDEIALRCAALPDSDARTPEEMIGYDERGLPI